MLLLADRQMRVLAADGRLALTFAATRAAGSTGDARGALDIGVTSARPARLAWATRSSRTDGSFVFTTSAGSTGDGRAALDIGLTSAARCFMVSVGPFWPGSFERSGLGRRSHRRSTM